ncbi:MAG: hypothetical protein IPM52_14470 [Bacteroidetes bacterium]|nr:hypothetical protein [Bacteroidota bacterium]
MKTQLDKIEAKVERLDERLDSIDKHLSKYNAELEFHVARTTQLEDELLPIVKHVEQVRGAGKLLAWIIAIVGALAGVSWIWSQ